MHLTYPRPRKFFLRRAVSGDAEEPARACEIAALESREMRPGERDGDGELPDDAGESAAVVTGWPLGVNIGERVSEARACAFGVGRVSLSRRRSCWRSFKFPGLPGRARRARRVAASIF